MSTAPRSKKKVMLICAFAALIACAATFFGTFGSASVCSKCGVAKHTLEWQVPLTHFTVFSRSTEDATPVNAVLIRNGLVPKHEHQWLFSSGGGNGITCAIGEGRHVTPTVRSDGVAAIIDASQRFGDAKLRDRLIQLMFDPRTSEAVRMLGLTAPTNGFADAAEFRNFLSRDAEFFDEMVAMYKKR